MKGLLKCHYDQILDTHFLHFLAQVFLGKFQSIMNIRTRVLLDLFSKNLSLPLVFLVSSLGENFSQ